MPRRFEHVKGYEHLPLPTRKTALSAGYDIVAAEDVVIPPGETVLVPTGVKAYMNADEVLIVALRSSLAVKRGLSLANGIGVIDADYADNAENDGHIFVALYNRSDAFDGDFAHIAAGERIAQGVFVRYGVTDDDSADGRRTGGFGSTGK